MKLSKTGLELIQHFEGFHVSIDNGAACRAYRDPGSASGLPITIGWGTTKYRNAGLAKYGRTNVKLSDTLTREQAELELRAEILFVETAVNRMYKHLNQNQFDAAVSFMYNCGTNTKQSQRLKAGDLKGFRKMLLAYVKGGNGKVLPGLVRRRKAEAELWDTPIGEQQKEDKAMQPTWINIVRHKHEQKPSYKLYAMNGGDCLAVHDFTTRLELTKLLEKYPSAGNATVGELNWHVEPKDIPVDNSKTQAKLTKTDEMLPGKHAGLRKLILEIGGETFTVCSGQAYAQFFHKPQDPRSYPGNAAPLPQGVYRFNTKMPEMAGGVGNWSAVWSTGLGPMWDGLTANFSDDRGSFGCHIDGGYQGTLGCIGFLTIDDCKRYYAIRKAHPEIREIDVDWGL